VVHHWPKRRYAAHTCTSLQGFEAVCLSEYLPIDMTSYLETRNLNLAQNKVSFITFSSNPAPNFRTITFFHQQSSLKNVHKFSSSMNMFSCFSVVFLRDDTKARCLSLTLLLCNVFDKLQPLVSGNKAFFFLQFVVIHSRTSRTKRHKRIFLISDPCYAYLWCVL
jgi:hypothetical protein